MQKNEKPAGLVNQSGESSADIRRCVEQADGVEQPALDRIMAVIAYERGKNTIKPYQHLRPPLTRCRSVAAKLSGPRQSILVSPRPLNYLDAFRISLRLSGTCLSQ